MDDGGKKIESIPKYVPHIMALTDKETEKYHKIMKYIIVS